MMPNVMQAATPDGQRRKSDPQWGKMQRASKLQVEKARTTDRADKAKIQAEIDKLRGRKPKAPRKRAIDTIKI